LKGNHLLQYDKAFSEEKEVFEKTKVHVIICFLLIFVLLVSTFFLAFGFYFLCAKKPTNVVTTILGSKITHIIIFV